MRVMRKFLLSLVMLLAVGLLALPLPAMAGGAGFGFAPQAYKSGYTYGNGIWFAPYNFTVYAEPKEDSQVLRDIHWSKSTRSNTLRAEGTGVTSMRADHTFFCFYPALDVAMMAVTGDTEDGNWVEVVYDQLNHKAGWVKIRKHVAADAPLAAETLAPIEPVPDHFGAFLTWQDFMKMNAKANGVYWLQGVKSYDRNVRSSNADDAKLIETTIIRDLKVRHLNGNWLLVEVLDFERNTPIGWVRWRDDNGNLMVFPNLSGNKMPILTTN